MASPTTMIDPSTRSAAAPNTAPSGTQSMLPRSSAPSSSMPQIGANDDAVSSDDDELDTAVPRPLIDGAEDSRAMQASSQLSGRDEDDEMLDNATSSPFDCPVQSHTPLHKVNDSLLAPLEDIANGLQPLAKYQKNMTEWLEEEKRIENSRLHAHYEHDRLRSPSPCDSRAFSEPSPPSVYRGKVTELLD
ncbi:hypothetical protein LTR95_018093 [Oleoguttula sp. CCFEE 5521]